MKLLSIAALGITLISGSAYAATDTDYLTTFADAMNNAENVVWPGFSFATFPILLDFIDTHHSYAFDFKPINPKWQPITIENRSVDFMDISNDDVYKIEQGFDNQYFSIESDAVIDKQFTPYLVMNPGAKNPDDPKSMTIGFMQDLFRQFFSFNNFPLTSFPDYNGFNQIMNIKLTDLEVAVLQDYLNGNSEADLQTAVAIHQYRQKFLNEKSAAYEQLRDAQYGYPDYIIFKSVYTDPQEYKNALDAYVMGISTEGCPSSETRVFNINNCFYAALGHFFGPIYSAALDTKVDPVQWKAKAIKENVSAGSLLQSYYNMSDEQAEKLVKVAEQSSTYHYADIEKNVDSALQPYFTNMKQDEESYENQSGDEVIVTANNTFGNIDAKKEYVISLSPSTNYEFLIGTADYSSKNINLEFTTDDVPHYDRSISSNKGWKETSRFKLAGDTIISVDGQTSTIDDYIKKHSRITGHQVSFSTQQVNLMVNNVETSVDATMDNLRITISNPQNDGDKKLTPPDIKSLLRQKLPLIKQK